MRSVGNAYLRRRLPSRVCWFTLEPRPRTGQSALILPAGFGREAPLDLDRPVDPQHPCQPLRHLELTSGLGERVVDHLGQHLRVPATKDDLGAARKDGMSDSKRLSGEYLPARRPQRVSGWTTGAGECRVPAGRGGRARERRGTPILLAPLDDGQSRNRGKESNGRKEDEALRKRLRHVRKCGLRSGYGATVITYQTSVDEVHAKHLVGFFVDWPTKPSPKRHLALLHGSDQVVLARDTENGQVVGFVTAVSDGVVSAFLPLLEVLPEYKGRGIGSELVRRMLKLLEGHYMVDLCCDEDLVPFYERFGMQRWVGMGLRNRGALAG